MAAATSVGTTHRRTSRRKRHATATTVTSARAPTIGRVPMWVWTAKLAAPTTTTTCHRCPATTAAVATPATMSGVITVSGFQGWSSQLVPVWSTNTRATAAATQAAARPGSGRRCGPSSPGRAR